MIAQSAAGVLAGNIRVLPAATHQGSLRLVSIVCPDSSRCLPAAALQDPRAFITPASVMATVVAVTSTAVLARWDRRLLAAATRRRSGWQRPWWQQSCTFRAVIGGGDAVVGGGSEGADQDGACNHSLSQDDVSFIAELRSRARAIEADARQTADRIAQNWKDGRALASVVCLVDDSVRRVVVLGDDLLVGTATSGIHCYRLNEELPRQTLRIAGDKSRTVMAEHQAGLRPETSVASLAFDGRLIAAGLASGRLHVWDAYGNAVGEVLPPEPDSNCLVCLVDGIVFAATGTSLRAWQVPAGRVGVLCKGDASVVLPSRVHCLSPGPHGTILVGLHSGGLELRGPDLALHASHALSESPVSAAGVADNGDFLTGTSAGDVVRWRETEGRLTERWRGKHTGRVISIAAVGADIIVTGALDGTLRAWNADTGDQRFAVPGYQSGFGSICVQDDHSVMVTDGHDRAVYRYDFRTPSGGCQK
mmetsp:Transcript_86541/g.242356  ORF Transcript_86541/g.242356 Transcript_86541/m.242356 type:complete len:477 (-) Transcript_86541:153-1583(-)